jgi:Flp pilus assembly protein TadD
MLRHAVSKESGAIRSRRASLLILWALFPIALHMPKGALREELLVPLLIFSVWLLSLTGRYAPINARARLGGGAASWLIGGDNASSALLFIALETAWLIFKACRPLDRKALALAAFFAIMSAIPIIPVCAWNSHLAGRLAGIQDNGGFNLYLGCNPEANGTCYLRSGREWSEVHDKTAAEAKSLGASKDSLFLKKALEWAASHPVEWGVLTAKKTLYALNFRELPTAADFALVDGTFIQKHLWWTFGPLAFLALLGLFIEIRGGGGVLRKVDHLLILGVAFWLVQVIFVCGGRYRQPMHPALLTLAALALCALPSALCEGRKKVLGLGCAAVLAALIVFAPKPPLDIERLRAEAWATLSEAYFAAGDISRAEAALDNASGAQAWHGTMNLRGKTLEAQGKSAAAKELYEKAIELFPNSHYAYMNLGALDSEAGRVKEAEELFGKALKLKPDDPDVLYNLGFLRQREGRNVEALELYRKALAVSPAHKRALNNAGASLLISGDAKGACAYFRKASALDPNDLKTKFNLAVALAASGDKSEARKLLEGILKKSPGEKRALELRKTLGASP